MIDLTYDEHYPLSPEATGAAAIQADDEPEVEGFGVTGFDTTLIERSDTLSAEAPAILAGNVTAVTLNTIHAAREQVRERARNIAKHIGFILQG